MTVAMGYSPLGVHMPELNICRVSKYTAVLHKYLVTNWPQILLSLSAERRG